MLGSGIYGTVAPSSDETLHLEVSPGTIVKVARQAVVKVIDRAEATTGPSRRRARRRGSRTGPATSGTREQPTGPPARSTRSE